MAQGRRKGRDMYGFSWWLNTWKGFLPGVWGLFATLVAQKLAEFQATGTLEFTPDERQLVVSVVSMAGVWLIAQINNWRKNHPNAPRWLRDLWGLWPVTMVLLCVSLAGCATGGPMVTVTYPDGRVETRTDTAAVAAWGQVATATIGSIADSIQDAQAAKAQAEAAGDKLAAEREAQRLELLREALQARKAGAAIEVSP